MHPFNELAVGIAGILVFANALSNSDFIKKFTSLLAICWIVGMLFIFLNGMAGQFNAISSASSAELFGFIGRVAGIFGCAKAFCVRFPGQFQSKEINKAEPN